MPPGYKKVWHLGVRASASRKLLAFIGGTPATLQVYDIAKDMVDIDFLCVHKKLRSKRLAPVLIKEITRRVHVHGKMFQAVFTAGARLPKPVSDAVYYHRSLNPKKLIEVKFSFLRKNMTLARTIKLFKLPEVCFETLNLFVIC
jgi:glycylpeptide N-tetradecanoyltransferase